MRLAHCENTTTSGQMLLPLVPVDAGPAVSFDGLFAQPDGQACSGEIDRLKSQLAAVTAKQSKDCLLRQKLGKRIRKRSEQALLLAAQIESIERNPYAILRYRSQVPDWQQSSAWYNQPISELRPERIPGLGGLRLRLLIELCPTIGDLEALRIYEGFTSIEGIGPLLSKRIERRLLAWISRRAFGYCPKPSFEDYQGGKAARGCRPFIEHRTT